MRSQLTGGTPSAPTNYDEMTDETLFPNRRSIRLKGYDYRQPGAYFITIHVAGDACLLGEVTNGRIHLNGFGRIVEEEWLRSADIRREIELELYAIMPNHFHAVVWIHDVGAAGVPPVRCDKDNRPLLLGKSLGALVGGFKRATTKRINEIRQTPGAPLWQRNYYERIVRSDNELRTIPQYILDNPLRWQLNRDSHDTMDWE